MKKRTEQFNEWVGGKSDEEIEAMILVVGKRKYMYWLAWLIFAIIAIIGLAFIETFPWITFAGVVLMGIMAGCACFCNNNLRALKRRKIGGAPAFLIIYLLAGAFVFTILVVQLAAKSDSLGAKILGY